MSTILETLKKFGIEIPADMLQISSEDLPYLMFTTMAPSDQKEMNNFNLLVAMAIRIEQLENEVFELKWSEKDGQ